MPRVKAAQAGRQGPAKRRLAEQFAAGEVITDMSKKEWKLGLPIGQGGFGCIYLGKCMTLLPVNCHPKDLCAFKKKIKIVSIMSVYRLFLITYVNLILCG